MEYYEFRAMNSQIVLASDEAGEQEFALVRRYIEDCERRFTRFSETSELIQLNRSAGSWFQASAVLFEVVNLAKELRAQTGGLFDPSILPELKQAGYDRSMDELRYPGAQASTNCSPPGGHRLQEMELDEVNHRIYLPAGMQIDLGGIAKGWIAEQAALRLSEFSHACAASAGGDMFITGLPEGESAWPVGLEDPLNPQEDITVIKAHPGAVVTSSVMKRRWMQGDRLRHHVIDPRSGQPSETDWLSVTVLAEHAAQAEALAKALLISGSKESEQLYHQHKQQGIHYEYIAVDQDGWLVWKLNGGEAD